MVFLAAIPAGSLTTRVNQHMISSENFSRQKSYRFCPSLHVFLASRMFFTLNFVSKPPTLFSLELRSDNHLLQVVGENKELPLYGSGGFKFLWDTKFDAGMSAFLECQAEFQQHVEAQGAQNACFCFPYRINKNFIEDRNSNNSFSIK